MINAYKQQAQYDNKQELSKNVFKSILLYLEDYKDTSKTKDDRKRSIDSAFTITEWVVHEMQQHVQSFEQEIVLHGFNNILSNILAAKNDFSKVQDVKDSIGFLKIMIN